MGRSICCTLTPTKEFKSPARSMYMGAVDLRERAPR